MADFDAFDRMSRTLRGATPLPPGSPMASMARSLRDPPAGTPRPTVPAYDAEVTQRAKSMAASRQAAGGMNATAGATQTGHTGQPGGPILEKTAPVGGNPAGGPGGPGAASVQPVKPTLRGLVAGPGFAGGFGAASQGLNEAGSIATGDPTRIAESTARIGAAGAGTGVGLALGTKIGAGLGALTGPFAPIAVPALGFAGGLAGAWAGGAMAPKVADAAIGTGRALTSGDTDRAWDVATAQTPAYESPPTPDAPTTSTLRAPTAFAPTQTTRSARDLPGASGETLRGAFGNFSPAGTFADGFTDMGGGIARNGSAYTNIGANGLPTAMSGQDTRTPDQIANGERIKAETARTVAAAGGLGNLQRQNALMAANLRDQNSGAMNFGGMTTLGTGMRGNMRVSDGGGGGLADQVNDLRRAGIKVSHSTLRQMMQSDTQLRTNAETNQTALRNNAATNETSRTNNQDSNRTSEANNLRSNATQLETAALPARLQLQAGQQKRAAVSEALRLSGGDQAAAAQALSAAGYTDVAKDLTDQASAEQAAAKGAVEFNRNLTAASSVVTDDKGNEVVSPARQAVNASALRQMVSNYDQLTPREKVAAEAKYHPALNILNGMNDRREDTLFKKFGWDQAPAHTTLPDGLRGAHLEAVGPWEGMMTADAERGDYALRLPDKTTRYINARRISQAEKQFLKERGVTLGEK